MRPAPQSRGQAWTLCTCCAARRQVLSWTAAALAAASGGGRPTWSMWRARNLVTRPRLCSRVPLLLLPVFLLLPEDPMTAALLASAAKQVRHR